MTDTVGYYNRNAARYVADTLEADLSALHERFLARIPGGGFILDAGCGSGRDSRAFLQQGFRVRAFDAASEIARLAAEHIKQPVQVQRFEELDERADEIDLAVSFVKITGLRMLLPDLHAALSRTEEPTRPPARVRIVASDSLDVTDPEALRLLMPLQEQGTQARAALAATRLEGYRRGLVVLATGLGKTWLAAFDAEHMGTARVLFVAHREEILSQAADTFARIRTQARIGFYMGAVRDTRVDVLCASVQTLGKSAHLERFPPNHFDYIVIDEFHHAAAPTYRRLLGLSRGDALQRLTDGRLQVIFSVDLFSEGVDLPTIDTILMLRPTESKILFLQQLGRGLRRADGKEKLVVLDFIGNHHAFLHKTQALAQAAIIAIASKRAPGVTADAALKAASCAAVTGGSPRAAARPGAAPRGAPARAPGSPAAPDPGATSRSGSGCARPDRRGARPSPGAA